MSSYKTYMIIPEKKLILGYVSGKITWKEVIEFKRGLTFDQNYSPNFNIIDDIRDVIVELNDNSDILEFIEFANSDRTFFGSRKSAVITISPNQVVNTELLIEMKKDLPINFKAFSSTSAAFEWIGIPSNEMQNIDLCFNDLRSQPGNTFI